MNKKLFMKSDIIKKYSKAMMKRSTQDIRIQRELLYGERQREDTAEVASELRMQTVYLSSVRRVPHVTGEEVLRLRRVREKAPEFRW